MTGGKGGTSDPHNAGNRLTPLEILVGNCNFSYHLEFNAPEGCSHWNSGKSLDLRKLES